MRKLLSCIIVALMIVSSIVPVFAYSTEDDVPVPATANTFSIWATDIEYNKAVDGAYVTVTLNVANNTEGFEYVQPYIFYPECLTLESTDDMEATEDYDGVSKSTDLTPSGEKTRDDVEAKFERAMMTNFGYDVGAAGSRTAEQQATYDARLDALFEGGYKYTSPLFDFARTTKIKDPETGRNKTVADDFRENGEILYIYFKYDETKNPYNQDLTIKVLVDPIEGALHCKREGYEYDNEWAKCESYGCIIDVKPDMDNPCANGHTWNDGVVTTAPTCTTEGVLTKTCTVCSATTTEPIAATGHSFVEGETVPASCTTAGYTLYECENCDATEQRDEVPATGHTAGASNLTVEPTASSEGRIDSVCATCGEPMDAEVLPAIVSPTVAIADKTVIPNAAVTVPVALTNGNYGIDDVTFTITWAKALGAEVAITLGDLYTEDDEIALGALVEGETTYSRKVTITTPVADLTEREGDGALVNVAFTAPAEDGDYAVAFATDDDWCAQIIRGNTFLGFIDYTAPAAASATITVSTAACDHNYVGVEKTPATCTAKGVTTYTCTICGDSYDAEDIDMIPHTPADAVAENVVEPSCTEAGSHDNVVYCSVCHNEISREAGIVDDALGHNYVVEEVVAPTCTVGGYTLYKCTRCQGTIEDDRTEALGHNYVGVETTPATCSELGVMTYTCSRCQDSYTEDIEKIPHTPKAEWEEVREATPEEDGLRVLKCSVCEEVLESEVIHYTTLELTVVAGTDTVSATVDNTNRVINITSKLDAKRAVFQLKLPHEKTNVFSLSEEAFAAGNKVKISGVEYADKAAADAATGIRYFMSYATGGFNQSFVLEITTADGKTYEYTVNVTFDHSPACTGATPGHTTESAGFDAEDPSIIRIVAKAGQTTANFKFKDIKKGTRFEFPDGNQPHLIQTADGGVTYTEFAEHDPNVICYLKSNKAEPETCDYKIDLVYKNGDKDSYRVIVTFPEP